MRIQSKKKEFSATLTSGASSIIQDKGSKVSIEVAKGTRAIIMQHIHTNLEALVSTTSSNECIVSPVVTVHTVEINREDQFMELDPLLPIKPGKSEDQLMEWEPVMSKSAKSEDQPMKQDPVLPIKPGKSEGQPMEVEPATFKPEEDSDDDQSMKLEPQTSEEKLQSDDDQSMKLKPQTSEEELQSDDDQSMKLEPQTSEEELQSDEWPSQMYRLSPQGSKDLGHQSTKPETKILSRN